MFRIWNILQHVELIRGPDVILALMQELTDRQRQIALLVAKGLSNQEICRRLQIAEQTVKNHLFVTFKKLRARNRVEAANKLMTTVRKRTQR
jgi:DNA-binding NarL/FixJ family response regulator